MSFWLNTSAESVAWTQGPPLHDVQAVVDAYFHTHPGGVDDVWVLNGTPQDFSLLSDRWKKGDQYPIYGIGVIDEMRENLRSKIKLGFGDVACRYSDFPRDDPGEKYGRKVPCPLSSNDFTNMSVTLVSFFQAQLPIPSWYITHLFVRLYYLSTSNRKHSDDGGPSSLCSLRPNLLSDCFITGNGVLPSCVTNDVGFQWDSSCTDNTRPAIWQLPKNPIATSFRASQIG